MVEVSLNKKSSLDRARKPVRGLITERDAEALKWVVDQGVLTVDQLFRAVYSDLAARSSRYTYTRIRYLESCGLLASVSSPHKKDRFLKATKKTLTFLLSSGMREVPRSLNIPTTAEIPHAEVLTELRIEIQKSGKCDVSRTWWRSESSLMEDDNFPAERFRELMPDALWITKSGKRIAIEFERTRKGITRVRKKVEGLEYELNRPDRVFDLVLWVAVDGAYRDVKKALSNRQTLRSVAEFIQELRSS